MTSFPPPMCISCARLYGDQPGMACEAFPDGIPDEILESAFDHRQSIEGEPVFMQNPEMPPPDWEMLGMADTEEDDDEIEDYTSVAASALRRRVHRKPVMATATSSWNADKRKQAAAKGHALPDGSYPIKDKADWYKARQAIGRGGEEKRSAIISHLKKRGKALGIPDSELEGLTAAANALTAGPFAESVWDPLLHPRGRNGRFIEVGGWVQGLFSGSKNGKRDKKGRAQVVAIEPNPSDNTDPIVVVEFDDGGKGYANSATLDGSVPTKADLAPMPEKGQMDLGDITPDEDDLDGESSVGREALANQGVDAALLDKLSDDEANKLWEKLVHEDKRADDLGIGQEEMFRRRARELVTNLLLDRQIQAQRESGGVERQKPKDVPDDYGTGFTPEGEAFFKDYYDGLTTPGKKKWDELIDEGFSPGRIKEMFDKEDERSVARSLGQFPPSAPAHFVTDMKKLQDALERGGWITSIPDPDEPQGVFTYIDPEAPEDLVRMYQQLLQMGYANGWI